MAWERSGVPGGRTRTSWLDRDVPTMWRLLENQQSDDHWRLVAGWRKASELTQIHLRRLEQYRANLTEAWPPDRNAAAAAYVSRLDFLIQNVRTTHEVAAANYSTLAATVGALASARQHLKPLYDEYLRTARAIKDHNDLVAFNAASEGATVIGPAPARTQDLERLNGRARAIMYELSHTLIEAEAAIRQPPTYPSDTLKSPVNPDVYGSPFPAGLVPKSSSPVKSSASIGDLGEGGSGLVLDPEASRPAAAAMVENVQSRDIPPSHSPVSFVPPRMLDHTQSSHPIGRTIEGLHERPTAAKPLAPGGVIGGRGSEHQSPSTRTTPRINPIGGIIGGEGPSTHGRSHTSPYTPLMGFGNQTREGRRRSVIQRSPDTVWDVPVGVPPVIEPSRKVPKFDPGPTIGLSP